MLESHNEVIITVTKDEILINGMLCTNDNYQELMKNAGIGKEEALKIMKAIFSKSSKESSTQLVQKILASEEANKYELATILQNILPKTRKKIF